MKTNPARGVKDAVGEQETRSEQTQSIQEATVNEPRWNKYNYGGIQKMKGESNSNAERRAT